MIKAKTFHELYPKIIRDVLDNGYVVKPRGKLVKEVMCYQFCLEDPTQPIPLQKERGMNMPFSFIEALTMFHEQDDDIKEMLLWYVPKLNEYMNNGRWNGFYGDRQVNEEQMERCFEILKKDPDTRRAVMAWFNPLQDYIDSSDNNDQPCTLTLHFMIRDGKLDMIVHMRGNDILLGTPQNVFVNTFLQRTMASWLNIPVGKYYHRVNSMHAYLHDIPKLTRIMDSEGDIDHPFKKMGDYGMTTPSITEENVGTFFLLDRISREAKGKIAGTEGEKLRAHLNPHLRKVYDETFTPYYLKKFKNKNT